MKLKQKQVMVNAYYLFQRERWEISVWEDGKSVARRALHWPLLPDFSGRKFEKKVANVAKELSEYGVTKKQIEDAIMKHCKEERIKPPKYLKQ